MSIAVEGKRAMSNESKRGRCETSEVATPMKNAEMGYKDDGTPTKEAKEKEKTSHKRKRICMSTVPVVW